MNENKYNVKQENKNGPGNITINEYNYNLSDTKLDSIQKDTNEIKKVSKSKMSIIIGVISLIFTVSGVSVAWLINLFFLTPENKITLFSEYSKITIYQETNITATLNFDTDSVSITAYLASGKIDTLSMNRKNSTEWEKKVIFNETGIHKIVAAAISPNGNVIEDSIEIEVIPINFGNINFD